MNPRLQGHLAQAQQQALALRREQLEVEFAKAALTGLASCADTVQNGRDGISISQLAWDIADKMVALWEASYPPADRAPAPAAPADDCVQLCGPWPDGIADLPAGFHRHCCSSCLHIWEHADECEQLKKEHRCPACNKSTLARYVGPWRPTDQYLGLPSQAKEATP